MQLFKSIHKLFQPKICRLEKVPKYILFKIINYLPFSDLQNMSLLNQYFNRRMKDTDLWQTLLNQKLDKIPENPMRNLVKKSIKHSFIYENVGPEPWYIANTAKPIVLNNPESEICARIVGITEKYIAIVDWENKLYIWKPPFGENRLLPILKNVKTISCQNLYMAIQTVKNKLYIWGHNMANDHGYFKDNMAKDHGYFKNPTCVAESIKGIFAEKYYLYIQGEDDTIYKTGQTAIGETSKYFKGTSFGPLDIKAKKFITGCDFICHFYFDLQNTLYAAHNQRVAKNVLQVYSHKKFVYWIDTKNKLYRVECGFCLLDFDYKMPQKITTNVKKIAFNDDRLYILSTYGKLYRVQLSNMIINEPILDNVQDIVCGDKFAIVAFVK